MKIRVWCSPDADDRFMMRALVDGSLDTSPFRFEVHTAPTDALNRLAASADPPEVCAVSIAQLPAIADRYLLLPHGGSMGEGYGPALIAREPRPVESLRGARIGVPGLRTSAWTALRLAVGPVEPVVIPIVPYAAVFEALERGEVDAALVIHEGRLLFEELGFVQLLDLGRWWAERSGGLPLPLGGNVILRRLGSAVERVSGLLRASIALSLGRRDAVIDALLEEGCALQRRDDLDRYLSMYANARTLDYGQDGRLAIARFLEGAAQTGLLPPVRVEFAP